MAYKSVEYRQFDTKRNFGVELEIGDEISKRRVSSTIRKNSSIPVKTTGFKISSCNNYWHVKNDISCGKAAGGGIEVASFVASGCKDLDHITDIVQILSDIGCEANENCGLHIHVDVNDLDLRQVAVLLAYWLKIECRLSHALPKHRLNNQYTKYMMQSIKTVKRNKKYWPEELWSYFCPANLDIYSMNRFVTMNLVNYAKSFKNSKWKKKTIEFRWPEGTLKSADVKNWIRLFVNFVEHCANKPMPENLNHVNIDETLSILGLGHDSNSFVILSKELLETKTWFLERVLEQYSSYPYFERKRQTDRARKILCRMWDPIKKYK